MAGRGCGDRPMGSVGETGVGLSVMGRVWRMLRRAPAAVFNAGRGGLAAQIEQAATRVAKGNKELTSAIDYQRQLRCGVGGRAWAKARAWTTRAELGRAQPFCVAVPLACRSSTCVSRCALSAHSVVVGGCCVPLGRCVCVRVGGLPCSWCVCLFVAVQKEVLLSSHRGHHYPCDHHWCCGRHGCVVRCRVACFPHLAPLCARLEVACRLALL